MRACIDFHTTIPQHNRDLFLRVINDMTQAFSRYYTEEFFDMVSDKIYRYTVEWVGEGGQFHGWDSVPERIFDVAFDEAMDEYDGLLADRAAEAAEEGE